MEDEKIKITDHYLKGVYFTGHYSEISNRRRKEYVAFCKCGFQAVAFDKHYAECKILGHQETLVNQLQPALPNEDELVEKIGYIMSDVSCSEVIESQDLMTVCEGDCIPCRLERIKSLIKSYVLSAQQEALEWIKVNGIWGQVKVIDLEKGEAEWTMWCLPEDYETLFRSKYGGEK